MAHTFYQATCEWIERHHNVAGPINEKAAYRGWLPAQAVRYGITDVGYCTKSALEI